MDNHTYFLLLVLTGKEDAVTVATKVKTEGIPEDFIKYFKEDEFEQYRRFLLPEGLKECHIAGIDTLYTIYLPEEER